MSIKDELSEHRRKAIAGSKKAIHEDIEIFVHEIVHHINDCFIKMHNAHPTEKVLTLIIHASKNFAQVTKVSPDTPLYSILYEVIYSLPQDSMFPFVETWGKVISIGANSGDFRGFFLGYTLQKDFRVYKFIMTLDD